MTITITGLDEAERRLGRIDDVLDVIEPAMQRSVIKLQEAMADYPPQRPNSSYRRTGTLGRRWTTAVDRLPRSLRGTVGNNTIYGPFVQSARFQSAVHRGRWQTDEQVIEEEKPGIVRDFEKAIRNAIG